MSLVGFKAQNHPQQTGRREALEDVDNRAIRMEDFAPLHERFRFTIDAAATAENARLERYWSKADNAFRQSWIAERAWCNPPYSDIYAWVDHAWRWFDKAGVIVMLLPANRTEQRWWQELVEPYRDGRGRNQLRVEFLPGRMRFDRPDAVIGPKGDRPPFGCCLLIWGNS